MIYFLQMQNTPYYKVGWTEVDPQDRLENLQTGCPQKLVLHKCIPGGTVREAYIHAALNDFHANGEWFIIPRSPIRFIRYQLWKAGQDVQCFEEHLEPLPDLTKSHRIPPEYNWEMEMMRARDIPYSRIMETLGVSDTAIKMASNDLTSSSSGMSFSFSSTNFPSKKAGFLVSRSKGVPSGRDTR